VKFLLASAAVALTAMLTLQWYDWPPKRQYVDTYSNPTDTEQPSSTGDSSPLDLLDSPIEKEDYASIIERPVFLPERRPPSEEPVEPEVVDEQPNIELDAMDLNAIIITPSEAVAWVHTNSKPTAEKLRIGDELAGWTIKAIKGDEVELERQGKTDTLVLRDYSRSPPPVAQKPRRGVQNPARQPASRAQRPRRPIPAEPKDTPPRSRNNAQRPPRPR